MPLPAKGPDYCLLFDALPDPCLVLDRELRIVEANEAYLKVTGTLRAELIGRCIFAVFPENPDPPGESGLRGARGSLERVLRDRVTDVVDLQKYDIPRPAAEGGGFEERFWSIINTPLLDAGGELAFIIHRVQDLTPFVRRSGSGGPGEGSLLMDAEGFNRMQEVAETNLQLKLAKAELEIRNAELRVLNLRLEEEVRDRREAEEAISRSERKFSRIFHAAPALLVISSLKEGRILDANQTTLSALGYRRREFVGQFVQDIDIWEREADRDTILRGIREHGSIRNVELVLRGKNGRRLVGLYAGEVIEIEGTRCILSLVRDITLRKPAEEVALRAKEEWERTFDAVPDLIAIIGTDNRIVRVNRAMARELGRTAEECVGITCWAAFHGTDRETGRCPHWKAASEGREQTAEITQAGIGEYFWVSYTPLAAPDGTPLGVVHVARNITERKLAELEIARLNADLAQRAAELEAANRELEAFNYTAAHDLRQPLNAINGYCQAIELMCGSRLDDECRGYLRETYKSVVRMSRLIGALLDFSRMSRVELRKGAVDLSATAVAVAEELRSAEPQRQVALRIAEGLCCHADPDLLRVVLDNLLGNAWKYTRGHPAPVIEVGAARADDGRTVFFVSDNGSGFDPADGRRLFSPFQRLAGAERQAGFGIGLATVERIIERHGGTVWAEGTPGKGAAFFFTLPEPAGERG